MSLVGITALVPPEIIYATGNTSVDMNNFVPQSVLIPRDKLCAWTALWRELTLTGQINPENLIVVSGGDCNNAIVDGEKIELSGVPTHYFTYPFDGSPRTLENELKKLTDFLGNGVDENICSSVHDLKEKALDVDSKRINGCVSSKEGFRLLVSGSDLGGGEGKYNKMIDSIKEEDVNYDFRVALIGTPPIYSDFHEFLQSIGLHVVFDEMPYEFIRLDGNSIKEIARNYSQYTFARNIKYRLNFLKHELRKRDLDGVIHFHQFACHHKLEDPILREGLGREGYSYITIEADLPSRTTEQTKLRLEAFKEMLGEYS